MIGGACSTPGGEVRMQFWLETQKGTGSFEHLDVDGRIILKLIFTVDRK
jgi:hypothetical protein